jgi:hypothetical protein
MVRAVSIDDRYHSQDKSDWPSRKQIEQFLSAVTSVDTLELSGCYPVLNPGCNDGGCLAMFRSLNTWNYLTTASFSGFAIDKENLPRFLCPRVKSLHSLALLGCALLCGSWNNVIDLIRQIPAFEYLHLELLSQISTVDSVN